MWKLYKLVLYKLLSHRNSLFCTYFAAKTLFCTLGDQQPHEYYWNCCHIFLCCWRGFHGLVGCLQWGQWEQLWFRELQGLGQRNHTVLKRSGIYCLLSMTEDIHLAFCSGPPVVRIIHLSKAAFWRASRSNFFLLLFWNDITAAYSNDLSASLRTWRTGYSHSLGMFYAWIFYI